MRKAPRPRYPQPKPREEERRPARPSDIGGVPGTTYPRYPSVTPYTPPQIWPPEPTALPEDFYTGARAWWRDIDDWAARQIMGFTAPPSVAPPAFAAPAYGGGGVGGGEEGLPEPKFTMADIMQYMEFPQVWQYPSYMRDFGRYIEELLTQNPEYAVPIPELGEEGEIVPTPEDLDKLAYMETAENYAAAWNDFLQSLVNLPFFQQQETLGLRYTPATRWYRSGQIPMLPHPEYL